MCLLYHDNGLNILCPYHSSINSYFQIIYQDSQFFQENSNKVFFTVTVTEIVSHFGSSLSLVSCVSTYHPTILAQHFPLPSLLHGLCPTWCHSQWQHSTAQAAELRLMSGREREREREWKMVERETTVKQCGPDSLRNVTVTQCFSLTAANSWFGVSSHNLVFKPTI